MRLLLAWKCPATGECYRNGDCPQWRTKRSHSTRFSHARAGTRPRHDDGSAGGLSSGRWSGLRADPRPVVSVPDDGLDYEQTLAVIERSILAQALRKTNGNKKAAAEMLRLKRTTLSAKVRSLDSLAAWN